MLLQTKKSNALKPVNFQHKIEDKLYTFKYHLEIGYISEATLNVKYQFIFYISHFIIIVQFQWTEQWDFIVVRSNLLIAELLKLKNSLESTETVFGLCGMSFSFDCLELTLRLQNTPNGVTTRPKYRHVVY